MIWENASISWSNFHFSFLISGRVEHTIVDFHALANATHNSLIILPH